MNEKIRIRPPRLIGKDRLLQPYNLADALGQVSSFSDVRFDFLIYFSAFG
jgi:hypothetical protein